MLSHKLAVSLAVLAFAPSGEWLLAEEAHWSYRGASGPTHWAAMEPEFRACGVGKQ